MAKGEVSGIVTAFRQSKFKQDSYQTIVDLAKPDHAGQLLGARAVWARKDGVQTLSRVVALHGSLPLRASSACRRTSPPSGGRAPAAERVPGSPPSHCRRGPAREGAPPPSPSVRGFPCTGGPSPAAPAARLVR